VGRGGERKGSNGTGTHSVLDPVPLLFGRSTPMPRGGQNVEKMSNVTSAIGCAMHMGPALWGPKLCQTFSWQKIALNLARIDDDNWTPNFDHYPR